MDKDEIFTVKLKIKLDSTGLNAKSCLNKLSAPKRWQTRTSKVERGQEQLAISESFLKDL